jgi:MFS family permease
MHLFHKYHSLKIDKLFHSEFWLFELSVWLHVFSRSMIAVFIPIFLLKLGYSISQVLIFYIIYNIIDLPLNFFAKWTIEKIGARKVIILGTIFSVFFFITLYNLGPNSWALIILLALFGALYDTFYWVGHIYLFMKCNKNTKSVTKDTSILYIVKKIAGFIAPIIGAGILIFFEKNVLIIISVTILILSSLPLFRINNIKDRPNRKITFFKFFKNWNGIKEYLIHSVASFHWVSEGIIWPIFIYTVFKSIEAVAIIPVIASITAIILAYFSEKFTKINRSLVISLGAFLIAITWIARVFITSEIFYFASVLLVGLFVVLYTLPLDSSLYEKGEKKSSLAASTYRNFFAMLPRAFFYLFLYFILEIFKISFISAAIAMFLVVTINIVFAIKNKNSTNKLNS